MRRWLTWGIVATALIVVLAVRLLGRLDDPPAPLNDPAIRNIITLIALFMATAIGWVWLCFDSPLSRRLRWSIAVVSLLLFAAFVTTVASLRARGVLNFSGSLIPRVAKAPHESVELSKAPVTGQADFSRTSPADFPQFLGPDRNSSVHMPEELGRDWDKSPPRRVWHRSIGAGWSGFACVNGYAVTLEQRGDQECVVCYAADTGNVVWNHSMQARHKTALGGVGPRSTPTIYEDRVYALGATGLLRCLDASGQLVWSDDLRARYKVTAEDEEQLIFFGRAASPLVVDQLVVVPGGGPQGQAKNLVAFDRQTGQLVWESVCELPTGGTDHISYSSPSLTKIAGQRQILIVNESTVSGHEPATGRLLWSYPWPGRSNGNASASQAVTISDNRVLLSKGYGEGAELIELSRTEGKEAFDIRRIWKVARVLQTKFSNVVIHAGHAYGLSEGILECVALDTGKRRWKNGRYGHGQILAVNDLLLVLSEEGELHLVELNPDKFTHLAAAPALNGKSWNNLCLFGRRLLLRNSEEAVCLELN